MKTETAKHLMTTLADLADVYNARQPSQGALRIWKQALEGLNDKDIVVALNTWADCNRRYPTPAELRDNVIKEQSLRLEREDAMNKAEEARAPHSSDVVGRIADPRTYKAVTRALAHIDYCSRHTDPYQWRWDLILKVAEGREVHSYQRIFLERHVLHRPLCGADIEEAKRHQDRYPVGDLTQFFIEEGVIGQEPSEISPEIEELEDVPF